MDPRAALELTLALACCVPLVLAGGLKVQDRQAFEDALANFPLLRRLPRGALAALWPWAEIVVGTIAFASVAVATAAALAAMYVAMFAVLLQAWMSGARGSCGCFGRELELPIAGRSVLQVLTLTILALLLLVLRIRPAAALVDDVLPRVALFAFATLAAAIALRTATGLRRPLPEAGD